MNPRSLFRKITFFFAYHFYAKPRITKTNHVTSFGLDLVIPPTVFHPEIYFSSRFLAEFILTLQLAEKRVLDLGCGSGLLSLLAARMGASVVAVDINELAVRTTIENATRNQLGGKLKTYHGDLFAPIQGERPFDCMLVNPPFYSRNPIDIADHAWNAGSDLSFFKRLFSLSPGYLTDTGKIIYVISSDADTPGIERLIRNEGFEMTLLRTRRFWFETLFIIEARKII